MDRRLARGYLEVGPRAASGSFKLKSAKFSSGRCGFFLGLQGDFSPLFFLRHAAHQPARRFYGDYDLK